MTNGGRSVTDSMAGIISTIAMIVSTAISGSSLSVAADSFFIG